MPTFKWIDVKLMGYLLAQLIQLVYMQLLVNLTVMLPKQKLRP